MALLKNCLFASVALTLIVSACANKDLSVHRNVVCKTYRAPKSVYAIQSSESMTAVPAVAMVSDKFNVLDIAVGVNITHPNVGALKISLEAREPCSVHNNMLTHGNAASKVSCVDAETRQTRLLANYGGKQMDLYNTYFDDYAVRTLDKDEDPIPAPFTGIFKPLFSLKRLIRGVDQRRHRAARGGSKGSWSLTVTDRSIGQGDEPKGFIEDFEIILCTREKEGVDMSGFVDFVDALREPQPRPVHSPVNNELMEPIVEANSGPEEPPVEGFAFTSGGFGRFNPLLAPLQEYFKYTEAALLGLFTAQFYFKALSGLIPFPDPGPYDLSDPIPLEFP